MILDFVLTYIIGPYLSLIAFCTLLYNILQGWQVLFMWTKLDETRQNLKIANLVHVN